MASLRLVFWNVFNLFEVGAVDRAPQSNEELEAKLDRIAEVLNAEQPDLMALAEVQSLDLLERLLDRLDGDFGILWEEGTPPGTTIATGLAVIFKLTTIDDIMRVDVYRPTTWSRPRSLVVEISLSSAPDQGGRFVLSCNHWKSRMRHGGVDPAADQNDTAEWLGDLLASYDRTDCAVVVGDFNAEPWEPAFGEFRLRSQRSFSGALWSGSTPAYLYNTAWRFAAEPSLWDEVVQLGPDYRERRPKTTHGESPVLFDQLLVSGAALRRGPIALQESSVRCVVNDLTAEYTRAGVVRPQRWSWDPATQAGTGASDHFPLSADFIF